MSRIVLISGTDTGIGKTTVSCFLIEELLKTNRKVGACKLVETGCDPEPADGLALQVALKNSWALEDIVPHRFRSPVAPLVAAREEGMSYSETSLCEHARALSKRCEVLILEGAGGLLVPILPGFTFAELAARLQAEVILVVGSRLGCINHAALTFEVCKSRGLKTLGYVFNEFSPERSASSDTNRQQVAEAAKAYGFSELAYLGYGDSTLKGLRL